MKARPGPAAGSTGTRRVPGRPQAMCDPSVAPWHNRSQRKPHPHCPYPGEDRHTSIWSPNFQGTTPVFSLAETEPRDCGYKGFGKQKGVYHPHFCNFYPKSSDLTLQIYCPKPEVSNSKRPPGPGRPCTFVKLTQRKMRVTGPDETWSYVPPSTKAIAALFLERRRFHRKYLPD